MLALRHIGCAGSLVLAALLCGCVNLGPVREFAGSSARLTGYQGVTERYVTSADRQLADLPPDKRYDPLRTKLQNLRTISARDKDTLLKLHATTTGYMAALALLAGEDAYSLSDELGKVSDAIAASEELHIDASHVQAYSNIAQRVVSWALAAQQAKDVKRMVKRNGEDMDKLLEAMELATEAYGIVLRDEAKNYDTQSELREAAWTAELKGDSELTPARRDAVVTLLRRTARIDKAAQADALKAQQAAAEGLAQVRAAHSELVRNVDRLDDKQLQTTLRKAAADLKSIRQSLATL